MKLAIADPPYLGRGAMLYGPNAVTLYGGVKNRKSTRPAGDGNPDAHLWDDPESHRQLVTETLAEYDGWAVAMNPENLYEYLTWVPRDTRICSWNKPTAIPAGRIIRSWEPVLVFVPSARRGRVAGDPQFRDSLVALREGAGGRHQSFVGQKPPVWTRWVLDMLGYRPDEDTVDDLFGGSGAVTAEINQGVLL